MRAPVLAAALAAALGSAKQVTLSNVKLPVDSSGNNLLTGEATLLAHNGSYYAYFNNWGGCPGIDCCPGSQGCAACCFTAPPYTDPCVYTNNHSVVVYRTDDFDTWDYLGVALPTSARRDGIEFRPQVVFNGSHFVMWYEDRWTGQDGYAVAVSTTPQGPFTTIHDSVKVSGKGRVFVDDDGTAYHVRTGISIAELTPDMTGVTGASVDIPNGGVEGPSMFKRNGIYYILVGVGCCACRGGSNVVVYTAPKPLGPYTLQGDVGSNTTNGHVFDKHSPFNYVTKAQGSKVIPIPWSDGSTQYLWLGNQWVTSQAPGNPRNQDLLYWTVLDFDAKGAIQQIAYADETVIDLAMATSR